ncbi:MAG: CPBP family intramembrane metalloprotease [Bacteroidota bacterium]|nr:CPBP family intramembrane metalloprotease [Bacteroidota bacterium]
MNKLVTLLGLATLVVFGLGGVFIIEYFQEKDFLSVLLKGWEIPLQVLIGIAYGLFSAGIAWFIISRVIFTKERGFYKKMISQLNLSNTKIIFISLSAGVGEEIFFRGAIQPFLGVWLTAIAFVALHGYLNPTNWRMSIYGVAMVILMGGFGYLFEFVGLITVMTAHTVFDIVLLKKLGDNQNDEIEQV